MDKRDAAISLARKGFCVFRLRPGGKKPVAKGWQDEATSDVEAVRKLWTGRNGFSAEYNIGVSGKGLVVLDVDVPGDSHGDTDGRPPFEAMGWKGQTYTVRTPSGGLHYYFENAKGEAYRNNDLAPGLTVRAAGAYVVGAGSETTAIPGEQAGGVYESIGGSIVWPLPACIASHLHTSHLTESHCEAAYADDWDKPHDVSWCWRYVKEDAPEAFKGERGSTGLAIAHILGDRAISRELAQEMLDWWHEHKCTPNDDDERQMAHVLNSAYSNRRKPIGCESFTPFPSAEPLLEYARQLEAEGLGVKDEAQRELEDAIAAWDARTYKALEGIRSRDDMAKLEPERWLVPGKLIRGYTAGLVSPPGVGKSTLVLQWAAALAIGDGAFAGLDTLVDQEPVHSLVVDVEDPPQIMRKRLSAICDGYGLDFAHVDKYVTCVSGSTRLFTKKARNSKLEASAELRGLEGWCKKKEIGCIFLDPLVELHDGEENDNGEMRHMMTELREFAQRLDAAVMLIHHTRKPPQASSDSYIGDLSAGRGASAISGSLRQAATFYQMPQKDAELFGIADEDRLDYMRYDDAKNSWHGMSKFPTWYRRESYPLGNGETAPLLRPVQLSASDNKASHLLCAEIAATLTPGERMPLATLVKRLQERELYTDIKPGTLRTRIRTLLSVQDATQTTRGTIVFRAKGPTGGDVLLTESQDSPTIFVDDCE